METPPLQFLMLPPPPEKAGPMISPKIIAALALITLAFAAISLSFDYKKLPGAQASLAQTAAVSAKDSFAGLSLAGKGAIVFDLSNKRILYAKNPDAQLPLASLTKVPLAIAVSDVLPPDTFISIPRNSLSGNGTALLKGDRWSVSNLIDYTLVSSSNEGAEILTQAAEKTIRSRYPEAPEDSATLWRMNKIAEDLGLKRTFFINTSGLDESETLSGAYGSARDMAILFGFAAENYPSVFSGTSKDGVILTTTNGGQTAVYNTNEAIGYIPGLVMGKTGITDLAGGNLAVVFDIDRARIVAVVLGSTREGRFSDIKLLVERTRKLVAGNNMPGH